MLKAHREPTPAHLGRIYIKTTLVLVLFILMSGIYSLVISLGLLGSVVSLLCDRYCNQPPAIAPTTAEAHPLRTSSQMQVQVYHELLSDHSLSIYTIYCQPR